jgi:GTP pyrophosphokinase
MTIGDRIKKLREERKLTQAALAHLVGVAVGQIYKWESDKADPMARNIIALRRVFEVTYEEILGA